MLVASAAYQAAVWACAVNAYQQIWYRQVDLAVAMQGHEVCYKWVQGTGSVRRVHVSTYT